MKMFILTASVLLAQSAFASSEIVIKEEKFHKVTCTYPRPGDDKEQVIELSVRNGDTVYVDGELYVTAHQWLNKHGQPGSQRTNPGIGEMGYVRFTIKFKEDGNSLPQTFKYKFKRPWDSEDKVLKTCIVKLTAKND